MNDQAIEQEIQTKGLTAPRVTPGDIESNIAGEYFFTADQATKDYCPHFDQLRLLTFCVLVLKNGFTVTRPKDRPPKRSRQNLAADGLRAERTPRDLMLKAVAGLFW